MPKVPIRFGAGGPPGLAALFGRCGLPLAPEHAKAPRVVALEGYAPRASDGTTTVALFDGKLTGSHADLFRDGHPPLLLACRDQGIPSEWEVRALAVWLSGAELTAMAPVASSAWRIAAVQDLKAVAQQAEALVRKAGAGAAAGSIVADVMYELAANALLDAPHSKNGVAKYAHRRGLDVEIAPADACRACVAVADGRAYLSTTDLFGRLTATPIAAVLAGLGAKAKLNSAGGGAGLGLRRLVEHSDLIAARVSPGVTSEVLCAVDLGDTRRRSGSPKSLFFTTLGSL